MSQTSILSAATMKTLKTRILVLSDTHGKFELPQPLSQDLGIDVVLHCGDLSESGITFLDDGLHEFKLKNNAKLRIYASSATPNSARVHEWAFAYESGQDRYNPEGKGVSYARYTGAVKTVVADDSEIDVMMTHGPPKYRLDRTESRESIGCPHLFRAVRRVRPRVHCFGHVHEGYGAEIVRWDGQGDLPSDDDGEDDGITEIVSVVGLEERGARAVQYQGLRARDETLFLNAATMSEQGKLAKMPWLVEFELDPA